MLIVEYKLDGTNYPLWSYLMRHVLDPKGLWNIIAGIDVLPRSYTKNATIVVDEAGVSTPYVMVVEPPT